MQRDLVEQAMAGDRRRVQRAGTRRERPALCRRPADPSRRQGGPRTRPRRHSWPPGAVSGLRDPDRFEAWLHRLLVNACYREARRGRRRGSIEVHVEPLAMPEAPGALDRDFDVAVRDQLERGFRRLDVDQRTVLVMHYYLGFSLDEAADALGIPPGTVRSRLHRAITAMRSRPRGRRPNPIAQRRTAGMTSQTHVARPDFDRLITAMVRSRRARPRARAPARRCSSRRAFARAGVPSWLLVEWWLPMHLSMHDAGRATPLAALVLCDRPLVAAAASWLMAVTVRRRDSLEPVWSRRQRIPHRLRHVGHRSLSRHRGGRRCAASDRRGGPNASQSHMVAETEHTIAFWGDESPDSFFIVDADGSNVQRLTSQIWISTDKPPTWSPDGRFIAFSAESGPDRQDERLFVVEISDQRCHAGRARWTERRSVVLPIVVARRKLDRLRWPSACRRSATRGCGSSGPTASNSTGSRPAQLSNCPNRNGHQAPISWFSRTPPSMRSDRTLMSTSSMWRPTSRPPSRRVPK